MTLPEESIHAQVLKHSLDAVFLTRPDGTIIYANPAASALFGYTHDEFLELGRSAVVDLSDPRIMAAMAQRRETGRFQGIIPMRRKDGSRFSAAVSSAVYTDSSGEQRTSLFVRDITEQERHEEELRGANAALSRALAEVRQLQEILPICAYCKRIRNDAHYWQQVEVYIGAHLPVQFTHGICPSCYEEQMENLQHPLPRK